MASPNQFCSKCQQTYPVDMFTIFSNGTVKSWCKACCNQAYHDKKNGVQIAKKVPGKKNMKKNDRVCDKCEMTVKTFNYPMHCDCLHKNQVCEVENCNFETDCFGDLIWHAQEVHNLTIQPPIRGKKNYTCQKHMGEHDVKYRRAYYGNPTRRILDNEQSRLRYNKRKAEGDLSLIAGKRHATQNRDATEEHKEKVAIKRQTPEERLKAKRYEDCEIRKRQAAFRERMSHTFSQRKNWKYANTAMLRRYYKTHHEKYRERRNGASVTYRIGNKTLKLQQIKVSCQRFGRVFNVPDELAFKFFETPCFYCGEGPETASKCKLNGIDRMDSDVGYIEANVVPCCPTCNYMKKNIPISLFLAKCQKIHEYINGGCEKELYSPINVNEKTLNTAITNIQMVNKMYSKFNDITSLLNFKIGKAVGVKNDDLFHEGVLEDIPSESQSGPFVSSNNQEMKSLVSDLNDELQKVNETIKEREGSQINVDKLQKKRESAAYSVQHRGKIPWQMTVEEAVALTVHGICSYCGFDAKEDITLDRLDSSKGYCLENVTPSCFTCNVMKHDLTVPEFLEKVSAIVKKFSDKDVELQVQKYRTDMGLPNDQLLKRKHDKKSHKRTPTRKAIVENIAFVDLHQIRKTGVIRQYHSKCHEYTKGDATQEFVLCNMDDVKMVFPAIRPCSRCVASDKEIQQRTEIDHQQIPILTRDLAHQIYEGVVEIDVSILRRMISESFANEGMKQALSVKQTTNSVKEDARIRKAKSRVTAVAKYKPGEKVLIVKGRARKYHTHPHNIQGQEGHNKNLWCVVNVKDFKTIQDCKVCCDLNSDQMFDLTNF